MGWYRVDPKTGAPVGHSKLSKPGVVLLNAVPGVDDDAAACYFGDGPSDMVSGLPKEIAEVIGPETLTADEIRALFGQDQSPARFSHAKRAKLRKVAQAFWEDIESCYEDDWDRGTTPAERHVICEHAVERMIPQ